MDHTEAETPTFINRELVKATYFWPFAILVLAVCGGLAIQLYQPDSYRFFVPLAIAVAAATTMVNRLLTRLARPFKEHRRRDGVLLVNAAIGFCWVLYSHAFWLPHFIFGGYAESSTLCGILLVITAFVTALKTRGITDPVDLLHALLSMTIAILVLAPPLFLEQAVALRIEIYLAAILPVVGLCGMFVSIPSEKETGRKVLGPWEIARRQNCNINSKTESY